MQARPFTLSVVLATVIGGVNFVSHEIDRQEAQSASRPVAMQPSVARGEPLSLASPLDIDPRRMEAPAPEVTPALERTPPRTQVASNSL